jgi:hypothetical protein
MKYEAGSVYKFWDWNNFTPSVHTELIIRKFPYIAYKSIGYVSIFRLHMTREVHHFIALKHWEWSWPIQR